MSTEFKQFGFDLLYASLEESPAIQNFVAKFLQNHPDYKYDPYQIGVKLFKEGHGISSIWGAVACDADMDKAYEGYEDAKNFRNSGNSRSV